MPYSVKVLQYLDMKLTALGARWGYDSESAFREADISVFEKKVRHYEKETKREVTDKAIISPFIDPRGSKALADAFNIKLITNPEDVC